MTEKSPTKERNGGLAGRLAGSYGGPRADRDDIAARRKAPVRATAPAPLKKFPISPRRATGAQRLAPRRILKIFWAAVKELLAMNEQTQSLLARHRAP